MSQGQRKHRRTVAPRPDLCHDRLVARVAPEVRGRGVRLGNVRELDVPGGIRAGEHRDLGELRRPHTAAADPDNSRLLQEVDGVVTRLLQRRPGSAAHTAAFRGRRGPADEPSGDDLDTGGRAFGQDCSGRRGAHSEGTDGCGEETVLQGSHRSPFRGHSGHLFVSREQVLCQVWAEPGARDSRG
jgi:hypothetical protein